MDGNARLCRCLRCDAWIRTEPPSESDVSDDHVPPPNELPRPIRGRELDELVVIRAIAVQRGLHVLLFVTLAILLLLVEWGLPTIQDEADTFLKGADQFVGETRTAHSFIVDQLHRVADLDAQHVLLLVGVSLGYALLEGIEAVYLWQGKRWAEYLTVVATAALLPVEIHALTEKVTALRVGALLLNIAILVYLVMAKRLFGVRGGQRALERMIAEDVDWDTIHREAPARPVQAGGHAVSAPLD